MMPVGIAVNYPSLPHPAGSGHTIPHVERKSLEDHEIENRIRGHIRRELVERKISLNEGGRRVGVKGGTLSRILSEKRGFKAGFVLKVMRGFTIPSKMLVEEDPPAKFMVPGVPKGLPDH